MTTVEELREELSVYHGQALATLAEISERHRQRAPFLSELVILSFDEEPAISEGATWILKHELERGKALSFRNVEQLLGELDRVKAWQAQLHVCQSMKYFAVPEELVPGVRQWLTQLLSSPRPFLRAWSLDAIFRLLGPVPETMELLSKMEEDEAASVRARVRKLKQKICKMPAPFQKL